MSYVNQRFLSDGPGYDRAPVQVFDTVTGLTGLVTEMNLDDQAVPPLAPLHIGAYFVALMSDSSRQVFTSRGQRVDHSTGVATAGVTALTMREVQAAKGMGYPANLPA